ncbi:MAG: hypothetical protein WBA93_11665 [Microcoleaceae cyanobacterium]
MAYFLCLLSSGCGPFAIAVAITVGHSQIPEFTQIIAVTFDLSYKLLNLELSVVSTI